MGDTTFRIIACAALYLLLIQSTIQCSRVERIQENIHDLRIEEAGKS